MRPELARMPVELARRTSRRSFFGKVGRAVVALAGGGAPHLRPPVHHGVVSAPVRPAHPGGRVRLPGASGLWLSGGRRRPHLHGPPPAATEDLSRASPRPVSGGEESPVRWWLEPMLRRARAPHPGLLLELEDPDQWGRLGPGVLPGRPPGVLHRVPGAQRGMLSEPVTIAVIVASIVAGVSTLFGP